MIKEDPSTPDPYDTSITCRVFPDTHLDYGSYSSGLPSFHSMASAYPKNADDLRASYKFIEDFSKWAIENRVCTYCRFPWKGNTNRCMCDRYWQNKERIDSAGKHGMVILKCQEEFEKHLADKMEQDLNDETSLYSQMNREAARIKMNVEERKSYRVSFVKSPIHKAVLQKDSWFKWLKVNRKWLSPSFWRWKFNGVITAKKIVSIPIELADSKIIEEASFGANGNVCVKTKGGSVVVVPKSMVEKMKGIYIESQVVSPLSKE